jgi:cobalt/nickel transport system permease protein
VSSLVSVPVGPGSVHLLLNGLMGLLLGWAAVPAILVALILQAVFFGFGGILVLGVALTGVMVALALALSDARYETAAWVVLATYLPLLVAEALVTGAVVGFLTRVAPELVGETVAQRG